MKIRLTLFLSITFSFWGKTTYSQKQNLVLNPGFEKVDIISLFKDEGVFKDPMLKIKWTKNDTVAYDFKNWNGFKLNSFTKIFNEPNQQTGDHYGLIFLGDQKRSYLQGSLIRPLKKNVHYKLNFSISYAYSGEMRKEKLGVYFTETKVENIGEKPIINVTENFTEELRQLILAQDKSNRHFQWDIISIDFTAKGGEKYFTIGNFLEDICKEPFCQRKLWVLVDNFYLEERDNNLSILELNKQIKNPDFRKLTSGDSIVFNYILFDFDKSVIREDAFHYLKNIKDYLTTNPDLSLSIRAHTDSLGTNNYNEKLSKSRGIEVLKWLKENHIKTNNIKVKSLGENSPIADNGTEEGRQLNRRVEFTFYNRKNN